MLTKRGLIQAIALLALLALPLSGAAEEMVFCGEVSAPMEAEYVDFASSPVPDLQSLIRMLDRLPRLKKVDMFATPITLAEADALSARYPSVSFGWTLAFGEHRDGSFHTVRTDAKAFSTLHNNKSRIHSSADFEVFRYCPEMLALDLGHNGADDLGFLRYMPKLRVLILACNHIEDISPLRDLKDLQYLELFKNRIADISPLAELKDLLDVNLCINRVRDFSPLYGLTRMERLWVYSADSCYTVRELDVSAAAELKRRLPDTKVDYTSYCTAGGWRVHPRYDVIHAMFASGVYIPFPQDAPGSP